MSDYSELVQRLFSSDAASALTNEAGRVIEALIAEVEAARLLGFAQGLGAAAKACEDGRLFWQASSTDAKSKRESRDYESMAIASVHIEYAIRTIKPV